jgi:molybdopterin-guanine dinucleotide biosynthesis protein A
VAETRSAIVVAGGQSRRLGQDKRRLAIGSNRALLTETIERVAQLTTEVVVATGGAPLCPDLIPALPSVRQVLDEAPGCGPLGGICAGLAAVQGDLAIVVACDLPFLRVEVLRALLRRAPKADLVVPVRADGRLEMLHAIYRPSCLRVVREAIADGDLRLAALATRLAAAGRTVRFVTEPELAAIDPALQSFVNLNTADDLAKVQALLPVRDMPSRPPARSDPAEDVTKLS